MNDRYLDFVNSTFGARLARSIGLPQPVPLERYRAAAPVLDGIAVLGAGREPQLLEALARALGSAGVTTVMHGDVPGWMALAPQHGLMTGRFEPNAAEGGTVPRAERAKALIFDASGIVDSSELVALYAFFHETVRALARNGRVIILGRPPETTATPRARAAQRALEGFSRSLGKELRRGIAVNLVVGAHGAEHGLEATLRFLLSPRSAYVCGQVVRIGADVGASVGTPAPPVDWARPLAGRTALVSGAARGIGAAIAAVLARDGAHVIGVDVPQAGEALARTLRPFEGTPLSLDIAAPEAPAHLAAALQAAGGIDIVVHNAGITRDKTLAKMAEAAWQSVIDINLSAQERIDDALLAAGLLHEGARIVCVSSISGIAGNLGQTNYATSKAGVIGRVEGMAALLAARGITINAVAPGFIETEMTARIPLALREAGRRMNAMGQGGLPIDVAEAIAWFAQPGCAGVTGQVLRVCGQSLIGA
jgi:3-oxoacyl-[acyl-carrier protein] reductase